MIPLNKRLNARLRKDVAGALAEQTREVAAAREALQEVQAKLAAAREREAVAKRVMPSASLPTHSVPEHWLNHFFCIFCI